MTKKLVILTLNLKCDINYDIQAIGKYTEKPCK